MSLALYTVDPAEGLTSGRNVVVINGNGFRVYQPPATGVVGAVSIGWVPTVGVEFNGRAADRVAVLSDHQVLAVVPEYMGDPGLLPTAVDIRCWNIDDGVPVPGDDATLAAAYTYKRQSLTDVSSLLWVTRQFILSMRRHLIQNVSLSASPDYSEAPAQRITFTSGLPAVVLEGPECEENRFYRNTEQRIESGPVGKTKKTAPFTADLTFGILLVGRTKTEALNLKNVAVRYFHKRPWFYLPAGPADPTELRVRCWVESEWTAKDNLPNQTFAFENDIRLEGIELDDAYGQATTGVPVDDFFTEQTVDDPGFLDLDTEDQDA